MFLIQQHCLPSDAFTFSPSDSMSKLYCKLLMFKIPKIHFILHTSYMLS